MKHFVIKFAIIDVKIIWTSCTAWHENFYMGRIKRNDAFVSCAGNLICFLAYSDRSWKLLAWKENISVTEISQNTWNWHQNNPDDFKQSES